MRRSARVNAILAAIVVALAALVYWQVRGETARREPALSTLDAASIGHIRVRCTQCVAREFERRNGRWRMLEPYALDADDTVIARLIGIAASPVRLRHAADALDPIKVGLAPPLMTLELDALAFEVGMADALRGDRYVRVGGRIAMVPDRFSPFLLATAESELDRHLLPRDAAIEALRIDGVDAAERIPAWRAAIAAKIEPVAADVADAAGVRVELELGDGEAIAFTLRRGADGWLARRDSPALDYRLDDAAIEALVGSAPTH